MTLLRVVAVIQARCASERLPNKVMELLAGTPVVQHVLEAAKSSRLIDEVILATSDRATDDPLAQLAITLGQRVFRGSEQDVLGRFVGALEGDTAEVVVRLTADNPLLDPYVMDTVIGAFLKGGCDYASNGLERSWPRGLDTEVISRVALHRSHAEATEPEDREHVTLFVRRHAERFRLRSVKAPDQDAWPDLRLSLDTPEDLNVLRAVFDACYVPGCLIRVNDVIRWLRRHPEVVRINSAIQQRRILGKEY